MHFLSSRSDLYVTLYNATVFNRRVTPRAIDGGLVNERDVAFAQHCWKPQHTIPSESDGTDLAITKCVEQAWYCGIFFDHFGHFLCESIHRMWFAASQALTISGAARISPIILTQRKDGSLSSWMLEILEIFDICKKDIIVVKRGEALRIRKLFVPAQLPFVEDTSRYWEYISDRARAWADKKAKESGAPKSNEADNIFISRAKVIEKGGLAGERALWQPLRSMGFRIVHPQLKSIYHQYSSLRRANRVIFVEGSSAYLCLFLFNSPVRFYVLSRGNYTADGTQRNVEFKHLTNVLRRASRYKVLWVPSALPMRPIYKTKNGKPDIRNNISFIKVKIVKEYLEKSILPGLSKSGQKIDWPSCRRCHQYAALDVLRFLNKRSYDKANITEDHLRDLISKFLQLSTYRF